MMSMGMWSEARSCSVCPEERKARSGEAREVGRGVK